MHRTVIRQGLILGTLLATLSIGQAPPEKPQAPPGLLEMRVQGRADMVRPRLGLLPRETHRRAHAFRCLVRGARGGEGPQARSCKPDDRIGGPRESL